MKDAASRAATRIIGKFGGPAKLSRILGEHFAAPLPSAVQSWQNAGIPVKWQHEVLYVAKLAAISLAPEDFFDQTGDDDGEGTRTAEEEPGQHRDAAAG